MELAADIIKWFPLIPKYNNNRKAPPKEQLSLEIKRLTQLDLVVQAGWEQEDRLAQWREQVLGPLWSKDKELWPMVLQFSPDILRGLRQFIEYTRNFKNFFFDGEEITDPRLVGIRLLAVGVGSFEDSLFAEINSSINQAAQLSGDELKNFVAQCAGSKRRKSTAKTAAVDGQLELVEPTAPADIPN